MIYIYFLIFYQLCLFNILGFPVIHISEVTRREFLYQNLLSWYFKCNPEGDKGTLKMDVYR